MQLSELVIGGDARLELQAAGVKWRLEVECEGPLRWYWRLHDAEGVMHDEGVAETWHDVHIMAHGAMRRMVRDAGREAAVKALDPGAGFYTPRD